MNTETLGLIEPVHGRYCQVQTTVHAHSTGLSRILHELIKFWMFFEFLISYKLFPVIQSFICFLWIPNQLQLFVILVINLSVLSVLCPVLFLFWVRLGSLPLVLVAGSRGGCVHWTPPFLVKKALFKCYCFIYELIICRYTEIMANDFWHESICGRSEI
jgi:hypothetical protein